MHCYNHFVNHLTCNELPTLICEDPFIPCPKNIFNEPDWFILNIDWIGLKRKGGRLNSVATAKIILNLKIRGDLLLVREN